MILLKSRDYASHAATCTPADLAQLHDAMKYGGIGHPLNGSFIPCPAIHLHTTPNGASDTIVYVNRLMKTPIPFVSCFHASCKGALAKVNKRMMWHAMNRGNIGPSISQQWTPPPLPSGYQSPVLSSVLQQHAWPYMDIVTDPVGRIKTCGNWHLYILSLYGPDDILWIAPRKDASGKPGHAARFLNAQKWINCGQNPGLFICPSTFKPGTYSRSNANVLEQKFFIVESDELSKDEIGAVFRWFESAGYTLRAIVDTGGKSLHGWFHYPEKGSDNELTLRASMEALQCDTNMLSPSQPCRLPGWVRPDTGRIQQLIYFK